MTIRAKSIIPSLSEYEMLRKKYPAFAGATLSLSAQFDGVYESKATQQGWFPLRTPVKDSESRIYFGSPIGIAQEESADRQKAGLRLYAQLKYVPTSKVVQGSQDMKKTSLVYTGDIDNIDRTCMEEVTSTAPCVSFAGINFVWFNKDECEAGQTNVMRLISVDLVTRAKAFKESGNDLAIAGEELLDQLFYWDTLLLEDEESELLIEGTLRREDDYETLVPTNKKLFLDIEEKEAEL